MEAQIKALTKRVESLEEEISAMKMKRKTKKNGEVDGRTVEGRELLLKRLLDGDGEIHVGKSVKKTCRDGKPDMRTIEGRSLWAAMEREGS
jgi:hypothetical protein